MARWRYVSRTVTPCSGPSATATDDVSAASSFCPRACNSTMALNTDTPYFSRTFQAQDELLAGTWVSTCRTTQRQRPVQPGGRLVLSSLRQRAQDDAERHSLRRLARLAEIFNQQRISTWRQIGGGQNIGLDYQDFVRYCNKSRVAARPG